MPYSKKSLTDFKKDLDGGLYQSATGARRAVGKFADWSEGERGKARKLIDGHFGESSDTPSKKKKKAPKKARGKKAAKKKAKAKAASKKAPKKAAKKAAKKKAVKAAAPKKASTKKAPSKGSSKSTARVLDTVDAESNRLGTYELALSNLKTIRDIDPEHDVSSALSEATEGIRECLSRLRGLRSPLAPETSLGSNGAQQDQTEVPSSPAVEVSAPPGLAQMPGIPGGV